MFSTFAKKLLTICLGLFILALTLAPGVSLASGLADSPWPVFHGNVRGTGLSPYDTSKINGTVKWELPLGSQVSTSPALATDGTIYIGGEDCHLHAINPDGTEKWVFDAGEPVYSEEWQDYSCMRASPVVASDGTVYIVALSNYMFAISSEGQEKWRYPIHVFTDVWSSPVIGSDGTIYVGSEEYPPRVSNHPMEVGGSLYAINPDGTLKWTYDSKSAGMTSTPAIDRDGIIYTSGGDYDQNIGTFANTIFAFNPDGSIRWKFRPEGVVEGSAALGADGTIYIGVKGQTDPKDGKFYALNPDGTLQWQIPFYGGMSVTPGIGKDGTLYLGNWEGTFYALTPAGKEIWHFDTPKATETLSSSPAIGAEGTIYFGSIANAFYALNPDGTPKWKMDAPGGGIISSTAIGRDDVLYVASIPGILYAIGAGESKNVSDQSAVSNTTLLNTNQLTINVNSVPAWPLIIIAVALTIFALASFILHARREKLSGASLQYYLFIKKHRIKLLILIPVAVGAYLAFTRLPIIGFTTVPPGSTAPVTSSEQKDKTGSPKIDSQTCPDHIYGKTQNSYYGTFDGVQRDLTTEQVEYIKSNCPQTVWPAGR